MILNGLIRKSRGGRKRVISLHEIPDRTRLREKLLWLQREFELVTMGDLMTRGPSARPLLALTFDDGYRCWHEVAAPLLEELRLPALFFVCSGFVGLDPAQAREFIRKRLRRQRSLAPLSKSQLKDLAEHPLFEIGSHTRNHPDLGSGSSVGCFEAEIKGDKEQLEDWTGRRVRWFAFPFGGPGNVSAQARDYLQDCRFEGAFTLIPGFVRPNQDRLAIGRDGLELRDSNRLWGAWLNGGYDTVYRLKCRFLSSKLPIPGIHSG